MNSTDGLADTRLQRQVFKLDFAYVLFIMLNRLFIVRRYLGCKIVSEIAPIAGRKNCATFFAEEDMS